MLYPIDYALQFKNIDQPTARQMDRDWSRSRVYLTARGAFTYAQRREYKGFDVAFAYVPGRGYVVWTKD
jgi:hypothetical protein